MAWPATFCFTITVSRHRQNEHKGKVNKGDRFLMKYTKTLVVSLTVILSLLAIAIPTTPALAYAYDIELDPE